MNKYQKRIKPSEYLKKVKGEVFTPLKGVIKTLSFLPEEVWRNPNLKWIDPGNGTGNFLYVVYEILMGNGEKYGINTKGLEEIIFDEKERRKHIIENMLYGFEIQLKNVIVSKMRLNPDGKYKDNIIQGDFFELVNKKEFQNKFDIVLGNPPYQYKDEISVIKKKSYQNYKRLYDKFTILSLKYLLKDGGYLLFILPTFWRVLPEVFNEILELSHLIFLHTFDFKIFGTDFVTVDIVLLQKKKNFKNTSKRTKIYNYTFDEITEIDNIENVISLINLIPNFWSEKIENMVNRFNKVYEENPILIIKTTDKKRRHKIKFEYGIVMKDNGLFNPITIREFKSEDFDGHNRSWLIPLKNRQEEEFLMKIIERYDYVLDFFTGIVKINSQRRNRPFFEKLFNYIFVREYLNKQESFSEDELDYMKKMVDKVKSIKRKWGL